MITLHIYQFSCRLAVSILSLLMTSYLAAQEINSLTLHDLARGNNKIFLYDHKAFNVAPILDPLPSNHLMTATWWPAIQENLRDQHITLTKSRLTIQLQTNEDTIQPSPVQNMERLIVQVKYLNTEGRIDSIPNISLKTEFNNESNTPYIFYNSFKIDSVVFAYIRITGIVYDDETSINLDALADADTNQLKLTTPISFRAKLISVHTYDLIPTDIPANEDAMACTINCTVDEITNDIVVNWGDAIIPEAATYTELQWTFINTYDVDNPAYNFRMNNTAVQISAMGNSPTEYRIPMIFEKGAVICRYRWVCLRGDDQKPVYSAWSLPESGHIDDINCGKITISGERIHEDDRKNWQYIGTYAEEGKHKDAVAYYDGTMRNRQNVTRLSQTHTVIVGETIYDFQGRPAIQVLPTPVGGAEDGPAIISSSSTPSGSHEDWELDQAEATFERLGMMGGGSSISSDGSTIVPAAPAQFSSQRIQYYDDFNLSSRSSAGTPYSWIDFDTGNLCNDSIQVPPMSEVQGSARYYSSNNEDQSGFNAFIPEANGYPFLHTEYTPDNTGRIRRQGAAGQTFQLRNGHDTQYYYGAPSQDELDRLFGTDAGYSAHYKKNMVKDGNNQIEVQYVDMKGNVIASGLAGESSSNTEQLDNKWRRFHNTMDLLSTDTRMQNELDNTLRSNTRLLIESDNTTVTFAYDLPAKQFSKTLCSGVKFCLDCEYDYEVKVLDHCGRIRWSRSQRSIGASILNATCFFDTTIHEASPVILNKGVYSVSRTLSVSPASIETYGLLYDTTAICQKIRDSLKVAGNLNFPRGGCNLTCETYALGDIVENTINGISMPYVITQHDIDLARSHRDSLCKKKSSTLENVLQLMLSDVSPNGMYGEVYQTSPTGERVLIPLAFPLSVFNTSNLLGDGRRNWKYPSKNKFNPDGQNYYEHDSAGLLIPSWVTIPVNREFAYCFPDHIEDCHLAPGKFRIVEGRLQVKPEELRDMRDFIGAWNAEWASALLPYHPEYPSLLWYIDNAASHNYDEALNNTITYSMATSSGWSDIDADIPALLNDDEYFSGSDTRRISARHNIIAKLFAAREGRRPLEVMSLGSAHCAIEGITATEFAECLEGRELYRNVETQDAEWQFVRALYLQYKHHLQDSLRRYEVQLRNTDTLYMNQSGIPLNYTYPSDLQIGDSLTRPSNIYWDKQMRLPTQNDFMKNFLSCPQMELMSADLIPFKVPNIACMKGRAEDMLIGECNKCPVAQELESFLWLLASENKLTSNVTDGLIGRFISTNRMIRPLGSSQVRRMSLWPVVSGNEMTINIDAQEGFRGSGIRYSQFIKLKSTDTTSIQWDKIRIIRCLNYTNTPVSYSISAGKNFTLKAIDEFGREFQIEGISSCYKLDSCKNIQPPCNTDFTNNNNASKNTNTIAKGDKEECAGCCAPYYPNKTTPVNNCEKNRQNLISFYYGKNLQEIVNRGRTNIRKEYTDVCLENADAFKATLDNSIYQITLFYYDQAGNLVKTIPPSGVDTLSREDIRNVQRIRNSNSPETIYPLHRLATTYTYNALSQMVKKTSPDAGTVQMFYDSLGRVHLSQDAVQAEVVNAMGKPYSYILFDKLGRITEGGQAMLITSDVNRIRSSGSHHDVKSIVNRRTTQKKEVVRTYYDRLMDPETSRYFGPAGQQMLRNRIASTVFIEEVDNTPSIHATGSNYDHATHYSYDYQGNVKTLIQENRDAILIDLGQSRKRIDYDFDLISGKVNSVCYQCDSTDQFIHRYVYDDDNRITAVYSGTRHDRLQRDAQYIFYKHGPLARIELGDRKVQGIDYAYTLQGWLKGINSNNVKPENDMGRDGLRGGYFARDRYGFSMNYFTEDYSPIADREEPNRFLAGTSPTGASSSHLLSRGLYNGNIASTATTLQDASGEITLLNLFTYDQLQRVKSSTSYACLNESNQWGNGINAVYRSGYQYDPNGNITRLTRHDGNEIFDDISYTYPLSSENNILNNQLLRVTDHGSSLPGGSDMTGNIRYTYDSNGNTISENDTLLEWTASGRIKQYGDQHYAYDAAQRRVKKTDSNSTQFYVYDATGNILALYNIRNDSLFWTGSPIYGTSRLGMYHANEHLPPIRTGRMDILLRGKTEYELTNHLGDVIATITDKKITRTEETSLYCSDIISAQEFLPFGVTMPDRQYIPTEDASSEASIQNKYPFAYNGMEQDDKNNAAGYTTQFRQYNPNIGRWMSVDPVFQPGESPYNAFGNNPVAKNDVRGDVDVYPTCHNPRNEELNPCSSSENPATVPTAPTGRGVSEPPHPYRGRPYAPNAYVPDAPGGSEAARTRVGSSQSDVTRSLLDLTDGPTPVTASATTNTTENLSRASDVAGTQTFGVEGVNGGLTRAIQAGTTSASARGVLFVQGTSRFFTRLNLSLHLLQSAEAFSRGDYVNATLNITQDLGPAGSGLSRILGTVIPDTQLLTSGRMGGFAYAVNSGVSVLTGVGGMALPIDWLWNGINASTHDATSEVARNLRPPVRH